MKPKSIHYLATYNSPTNRGGRITSTFTSIVIEGWPVAVVGDKVECPIDREATITTGYAGMKHRGKAVAIVGSKTSSGAAIVGSMQTRAAVVV